MRLDASIIHQQDFTASDFDIWNITAPNGDNYSKVSGRDMFGSGEIGQPELPYKVIRFLVPDNAYDFNVSIEDMSTVSPLVLENTIYPVQKDIPINDYSYDMFTYPDQEIYNNLKTPFRAEILEESRLEGRYHIVAVGLWPLAYSGNEKELEMCGFMQINLDYKEKSLLKQISNTSVNATGFINISDIVVNAAPLDPIAVSPSDIEIGGMILYQKQPRYYIISERSCIPALEDLAIWKTQKGYQVVTKAIEDIYADSRYKVGFNGIVDEAASLRKYLQDEFAAYGTFFCLLVGDHHTRMPIRKVAWNDTDPEKDNVNGDKYVPTDNYFADLSVDGWPLQYEQEIYVAKINVPFNPDIYVGRLLCNKPKEINSYINKLILYETNPGRGQSGYLDKTTLTVMLDGNGSYPNVKKEMEGLFTNVECLLDCKIANINDKGYPSGRMMLDRLNESGYCSWIGHGEPSTVACSGLNPKKSTKHLEYIKALSSYTNNNDPLTRETGINSDSEGIGIDQLTNYDSPSVVYTLACSTCPFDVLYSEYANYDLPHTMASSYTVGGSYGGVAYLGNTRSGYFGVSNYLEASFLQQLTENAKIGVAEAVSKSMFNVGKDKYKQHVRHTHNLIGDPEFELWTKSPSELNVNVEYDNKAIRILGKDALGCTVVVNDGEGGIRKVTFGTLPNVSVDYDKSGSMDAVGVYKTGFLPKIWIKCYNDNLTNCDKSFVVRNAVLGGMEDNSVVIGDNAGVRIRAVDEILCGSGLSVQENGSLILECDKHVELEGSNVGAGGKLTVRGEKVVLTGGFSVDAGGTLAIIKNL